MDTKLEIIRTGSLKIDPNYQRPLDQKRVEKMAANWKGDLAGALVVSRRNGVSYVIDGQQRLAAARIRLLAELPALVHEDLTPSQEASLFVGLNTEQRRPSFFDLYRARLAAGDEHAMWLQDMIMGLGLTMVDHQPRVPTQLRAALTVWQLGFTDRRSAKDALEIAFGAWPADLRHFESSIVGGIAGFVRIYRDHPQYSKVRLTAKLGEHSARDLYQRARVLGSTSSGSTAQAMGARLAVLEAFNRHLREPLDLVTQAQLKRLALGQRIWEKRGTNA